LQCGAVLPSSVRACSFCDSSFSVDFSSTDETQDAVARDYLAARPVPTAASGEIPIASCPASEAAQSTAWRGELAQRLEAYRTRRRKAGRNAAQSEFSFGEGLRDVPAPPALVAEEPGPAASEDDFSFTIAIGRPSKKRILEDSRMVIDVSLAAESGSVTPSKTAQSDSTSGLHLLASIDDRRLAALIDLGCLLFAYGGFLALFGSLGGHFTLSKLSAAVYTTTFAIVYLQYFALFTVFGGTTPGMMMRGLQVVSFSGEPPTPKQMLLRSAGYMLSAGTFFLGFLWSLWDEDELTWHDRLSRTYLRTPETFADLKNSSVAHT
jgi:uncharacterized RDD family membrane protein YckC